MCEYSNISDLMSVLRHRGIGTVTFAVIIGTPEPTARRGRPRHHTEEMIWQEQRRRRRVRASDRARCSTFLFVLLLFFMVSAGAQKHEASIDHPVARRRQPGGRCAGAGHASTPTARSTFPASPIDGPTDSKLAETDQPAQGDRRGATAISRSSSRPRAARASSGSSMSSTPAPRPR